MSAVILRAIVQKDDIPYIERFLKGIATNITFEVEPETSISEELEIELKERYMDFRKTPEQGIFLEDLKKRCS